VRGFQGSYRYLFLKTELWMLFVQIWNLILMPIYCSECEWFAAKTDVEHWVSVIVYL
jgi:hypothetical protein